MIATDDFSGIKRDISFAVDAIFQQFEQEHQRMPTTEEFRCLFSDKVDEFVGSEDKWQQIAQDAMNVLSDKEQLVWAAACELEAELRFKRSEFEDFETF